MMRAEKLPAVSLRALVYPDPESKEFLAHCLELDLMTSGANPNIALNNLLGVVKAQIQFALANDDVEHLMHPAPTEAWRRYAEILKRRFRTVTVPIDLEDEDRNFEPQLDVAIAS